LRWGATGKLAPGLVAVAATATGMGMGLGVRSVGWECSQRYNIGRLSMVVGLVLNVEKGFFSSGCSDFLSHGFFFHLVVISLLRKSEVMLPLQLQ